MTVPTIPDKERVKMLEGSLVLLDKEKEKALKLGYKASVANQKLLKERKSLKERIIVLEAENFYLKLPWWKKLC